MIKLISPEHGRIAVQICAAGAVAALLSGCSSDANRFNDPFSNPFSTGSIAKPKHVASAKPMGTGRTPPVVASALPPRPTIVASAAPVRAAAPGVSRETTGSIAPAPTVAGPSFGGWSASGGASIVVAQGESADVLSKRYGVPQNALLGVNGLHAASELQPGARITIPIYNAVATAANASAAVHHPAVVPARVAVAAPVVQAAPARVEPIKHAPKVVAVVAPAPKLKLEPKPKVVAVAPRVVAVPPKVAALVAPTRLVKGAAPLKAAALVPAPKIKPAPVRAAALPQPVKAAALPKPVKTAALPSPVKATVVAVKTAPAPKAEKVAEAVTPKAVDPTPTASVPPVVTAAAEPAGPEFRWPARGRIIQAFKGGTGGNDGINIAVPEGTAVKAAEGGVVAYAGSELKGYGNMVLIRHPNGFVSAYANNGEIDVKKGETVKRGQTIAKSGQTGNVASPQLHFELRKGAQPVDPTSYLAGL